MRVDFSGDDEVIFRKTADGMSRELEQDFIVVDMDVRMVAFHLGDIGHALDKIYRSNKILKFKFFVNLFSILIKCPHRRFI